MSSFRRSPYLSDIKLPTSQDMAAIFERLTGSVVLLTKAELKLLRSYSTAESINQQQIAELPAQSIKFFIKHKLLLADESNKVPHRYSCLEIEINRHCNLRCTFCPVAEDPLPRAFMEENLFALVLDKAVAYGIREISLNHYSEPTLNPMLGEYVQLIASRNLKTRLHTNASHLNEDTVQKFRQAGRIHVLINLPSIIPAEYAVATGSSAKTLQRVLANIELLAKYEIKTTVVVNSTDLTQRPDINPIKQQLGGAIKVEVWKTDSRAGLVAQEGEQVSYANELLTGCYLASTQLQVNFEGKVFLCCQDYYQDYVVGDLQQQSLHEIIEGEALMKLHALIFGRVRTPDNFLCNKCSMTSKQSSGEPLSLGTQKIKLGQVVGAPVAISSAASESGITSQDFTAALKQTRAWASRQTS